QKNRAEARQLMEKLGYGPDSRLKGKTVTRDLPDFRDNAIILIDQLKEIYIDGELDPIDTVHWFPTMYRKDYQVGSSVSAAVAEVPDDQCSPVETCDIELNYGGYCNRQLEKQFEQQSMEVDQE